MELKIMLNDIKNSVKARLYDMKYTPFLTSYAFFFVYFNAKLFLIFFDSKLLVQAKINMLSYSMVCHIKPILFALLYTLVFPFAQIGFYKAKLWFDKQMNKARQKIEDQELLSREESRDIRFLNKRLQDELDEYIKKFEQYRKEHDEYKTNLEQEYNEKNLDLEKNFDKRVKETIEELTQRLSKATNSLNNAKIENEKLKLELGDRTREAPTLEYYKNKVKTYSEIASSLNKNEKIILKYFYNTNNRLQKEQFKQSIKEKESMQKVTSERAIRSLTDKKILEESLDYIELSDIGLELVEYLFNITKKSTNT